MTYLVCIKRQNFSAKQNLTCLSAGMNRAINSALGTTRTRQKIEAKLTRDNESNANTFVNFALCTLSWNTNFQDYLIRVSIAVIKDVILKVLRGEIQEDMNLDLALQILKPVDINRRAMPSCPRAESCRAELPTNDLDTREHWSSEENSDSACLHFDYLYSDRSLL